MASSHLQVPLKLITLQKQEKLILTIPFINHRAVCWLNIHVNYTKKDQLIWMTLDIIFCQQPFPLESAHEQYSCQYRLQCMQVELVFLLIKCDKIPWWVEYFQLFSPKTINITYNLSIGPDMAFNKSTLSFSKDCTMDGILTAMHIKVHNSLKIWAMAVWLLTLVLLAKALSWDTDIAHNQTSGDDSE